MSVFDLGRKPKVAKGPMVSFRAAARKIEGQIRGIEVGGDLRGNFQDDVHTVFKAINRLDDRANKPEIRGDEAIREEAWAITKSLRAKTREAEAIGREARKTAWHEESKEIQNHERERILNLSPADRQYEQELRIMRGRSR